jgi:hypothetical protein
MGKKYTLPYFSKQAVGMHARHDLNFRFKNSVYLVDMFMRNEFSIMIQQVIFPGNSIDADHFLT